MFAAAVLSTPAQAQVELPEIVVTAPSPIQRPAAPAQMQPGVAPIADRVFAPVTIVPEEEIRRSPAATLGDVLQSRPGIASSGYAAGAGRPIIRGLDNDRVRIQENGVSSMDVSSIGEDHGVPIDPLSAQRIEVIRGPATLRWGSQAIGGVVNAENNRIPTPATRQGLSGALTGAWSSPDRGGEGSASFDARHGGVAWHGDFFQRRAGDYATPLGRQTNSALGSQGGSLGGSYIFDNGWFGVSLTQFNSLYRVPGINGSANATRIDLEQTKVNSRGELYVRSAFIDTIRFWFGGSRYRHYERGLDPTTGDDAIGSTFKSRQYEGRVEAQLMPAHLPFGVLTSAVGVQYGSQQLGARGDAGNLIDPATGQRVATYLFNELQATNALRFQAAGRIETVRVSGQDTVFPPGFVPDGNPLVQTPRTRQFAPMNVSFGTLYDLPYGVVASLTGQIVQRAPEPLELFARGAHEASSTFEIGNGNLGKETARSIEFGLRRAQGAFRFDFTAYHTRYIGFISKALTGVLCNDAFATCGAGGQLRQLVFTQRNATFTGAELSGQLDVTEIGGGTAGLEGQFDVVRARYDDGTNVARIPPVRIGGGVFWRSPNWFARVNMLHAVAQRTIDPAQETFTNGYNLLRADLSYTHKWKELGLGRELTLGVSGTNLLNANIRNHASILKNEILAPGRGVRVHATLRF